MSHGITDRDKIAYSIQNGVPWHGLGTAHDGYMTAEYVLREVFDWRYVYHTLSSWYGTGNLPAVEVGRQDLTTQETEPLYLVNGPAWTPLQPKDFVSWGCAVAGIDTQTPAVDTAFSLFGGRRCCLVIAPEQVARLQGGSLDLSPRPDDPTRTYLVLVDSADESLQVRAMLTTIRAICKNTIASGWARASATYSSKHTSGMPERLQAAREALGLAVREQIQTQRSLFADLEAVRLDSALVESWLTALFPIDTPTPPRTAERNRVARSHVRRLTYTGTGNQGETAYDAYNGLVEYVEHVRPRIETLSKPGRMDRRAASLLWGTQRALLTDGATKILALAKRTA